MNYPRDLDEYTDAELEREVQRRRDYRKQRRCPYCGTDLIGPACRYPEIHKIRSEP